MNKNTGKTRKTRFVKTKSFLMLVALFIFILILAFFFGEGGIIEIIQARGKIDTFKQNISRLEKEKEVLAGEVQELKDNPLALERKAREKLWLMKKKEKVVVIVREKDKEKRKPEKSRRK